MKKKRITIIDGYNVIHGNPTLESFLSTSLEKAREGLIRYCIEWKRRRKDIWIFYIVFDGDSSVTGLRTQSSQGIRVIYTNTNETADDRIIDMIKERPDCEFTVISNDKDIINRARGLSSNIMSVSEFSTYHAKIYKIISKPSKNDTKKRLSPSEEQEINESLKKVWGIN